MKPQDIAWLQSLDPERLDGTLLSVLLRNDLQQCTFVGTLQFLTQTFFNEKRQLQEENKRYVEILKKNGLYTPENIYPDL